MKIVFTLLCCLLWASCGPTTTSSRPSVSVGFTRPERFAVTLKKDVDTGAPSWSVAFTWTPQSPRIVTPYSYSAWDGPRPAQVTDWEATFFERAVNPQAETSLTRFNSRSGRRIETTAAGQHAVTASVRDEWWGTTREFSMRLNEIGTTPAPPSPLARPVTLTFPPMPPALVLLKMHVKMDAICSTPLRQTPQAACVRQLYHWRDGQCIKNTSLAEIAEAIANTPQLPPDEVLRGLDVGVGVTTCYSYFTDWHPDGCARIGGTWTTWHPENEAGWFSPQCLKEMGLPDILEAFAADP